MYGLADFDFAAKWSPYFIVVAMLVTAAYLYLVGPGRERWFPESEPVALRKKCWFVGGMAALYAAFGSPIDLMGHYMFTFHMISMALGYMIAAPMLLAGVPDWMLRRLGRIPGSRKLLWLVHPFPAIVMFNLLFSLYHFPAVHDFVMTNYFVHTVYYIILMITAWMMWFPVLCPLPELDRLVGLRKLFYMFGNSLMLMPACALIIFANSAMFGTYTDPELWATAMGFCIPQGAEFVLQNFTGPNTLQWFDPLTDQRTGGVTMKMIQEAVYGGVLVYVFLQWYRKENGRSKEQERDPFEPTQAYYEMMRSRAEPQN